jgi:hypothetical protein
MKKQNPDSNQIIPVATYNDTGADKQTIIRENRGEKPLNPYYVTGFADGESSFIVIIRKEPRVKTG